jgi:transglutaminase-like putative cysteine protease
MLRTILTVVVIFTGCQAFAQAERPYLFMIPAERHAGESGELRETIRATLHVPDAATAASIIKAGGALDLVTFGDGRVEVEFDTRRTLAGTPDSNDRADTFVIDYSEPAVADVFAQVQETFGDAPTAAELTAFVSAHIEDKAYKGTFDLASRVAATGTGDCTEHAVLLTALARASGYPARVAVGVVIIETDDNLLAFGHAWGEIHDGTSWQIADATIPENGPQVVRVRYLPFFNLDDEGPGFGLDLARLAQVQPARVSDIGNADMAAEKP